MKPITESNILSTYHLYFILWILMVELTYQMVLSTLQTAGLLVGIFYYVITLRNQQKNQELTRKAQENALESRNTQFFIQLFTATLDDPEGIVLTLSEKDWDTFDEWWEKNGINNNPKSFGKWFKVIYVHEMYGVLVKHGFLDIEIVDDLFSGGILSTWDKYESIIKEMRERFGYPQLQEHQEYLATEIRKIVKAQNPNYRGTLMK